MSEIHWLDHLVEGVVAAVGGLAVLIGASIVRLWKHDERLRAIEERHLALEARNDKRDEAIAELSRKVDETHAFTTERIDHMFTEIRKDLRVITTKCLAFGKHDDRS